MNWSYKKVIDSIIIKSMQIKTTTVFCLWNGQKENRAPITEMVGTTGSQRRHQEAHTKMILTTWWGKRNEQQILTENVVMLCKGQFYLVIQTMVLIKNISDRYNLFKSSKRICNTWYHFYPKTKYICMYTLRKRGINRAPVVLWLTFISSLPISVAPNSYISFLSW